MTREQKVKASEIRRRLRALQALQVFHRQWSPTALFYERRGSVHRRDVSVYDNEAAGILEGRR